jgi:hypothetical protein
MPVEDGKWKVSGLQVAGAKVEGGGQKMDC